VQESWAEEQLRRGLIPSHLTFRRWQASQALLTEEEEEEEEEEVVEVEEDDDMAKERWWISQSVSQSSRR
jgi:hypothetical protein